MVVTLMSILLSRRNLAFFAGALFAVLTIFTLLDKDVLLAEHVLTVIAILGGSLLKCVYRSFSTTHSFVHIRLGEERQCEVRFLKILFKKEKETKKITVWKKILNLRPSELKSNVERLLKICDFCAIFVAFFNLI